MADRPTFTPGPWHVWDKALWIQADNVKFGPMHVADVRGWGYLTGKGHMALGLPPDEAFAIQRANAYLIAAAPEMHEALKAAREWLSGWASAEREIAQIDAALAKAEVPLPPERS